eukprot:TRINITY_DN4739_c0_g1_i1.p1 TRINITY_DN4739_c0_g1~~TRINITY_DN4739_c0_g1_i1.p1  ORF type:complete len:666 (-),score=130.58 TRINITY_DN4739_c0_g1_i1:163-2160(-)
MSLSYLEALRAKVAEEYKALSFAVVFDDGSDSTLHERLESVRRELDNLEAQLDAARSSSALHSFPPSENQMVSSTFTENENSVGSVGVTCISAPSYSNSLNASQVKPTEEISHIAENREMSAVEDDAERAAVRPSVSPSPQPTFPVPSLIPPRTPSIEESLLSSMRTAISSAESAVAQQASQVQNFRAETDQKLSSIVAEMQKYADLSSALRDQLDEIRRSIRDQNSSVNSALASLSSQSTLVGSHLDKLDSVVARLSDQLSSSTERIDSVSVDARSDLERAVASFDDKTVQLYTQIADIRSLLSGLKKQCDSQSEGNAAALEELHAAVTTLNSKVDTIQSVQEAFTSKQHEVDSKIAELHGFAQALTDAREDIVSLRHEVADFKSRLPDLIASKVNELVEEKINSFLSARTAVEPSSPGATPPVPPALASTERTNDRSMHAERGTSTDASFNASTDQPAEDSHRDSEPPSCCFILSGMDQHVSKQVEKALEALGATIWTDAGSFPTQVTHVCSPPTSYTLRALGGIVSGRWVVTPDYVFKSQQAGSFLSVVPPFGTRVSPASLLKGKKVYLADSFRRDSPDGSRQYKTFINLCFHLGRSLQVFQPEGADFIVVGEKAEDFGDNPNVRVLTFDGFVEWIKGKYDEKMKSESAEAQAPASKRRKME